MADGMLVMNGRVCDDGSESKSRHKPKARANDTDDTDNGERSVNVQTRPDLLRAGLFAGCESPSFPEGGFFRFPVAVAITGEDTDGAGDQPSEGPFAAGDA